MKIIYVHHAHRENGGNRDKGFELANKEDLDEFGIKEAELLSEKFKKINVTAIVTSPFIRCKHTAEIINKYSNAPIIEDERFNETNYHANESFESMLRRNMAAIDDIVHKYDDKSTIICVTSGVNLSAFICYFYKLEPSNNTPWAQAISTSPVVFTVGSWDF